MKPIALFLNGVYEAVLEDILKVQRTLPEQIMFLQPYKSEAIARLRDEQASVDDPMRVLFSLTTDLKTVHYVGEIVGWDDKRTLGGERKEAIVRVLRALQPTEGGGELYDASRASSGDGSVNLLHVRRLRRLERPFSVTELRNAQSGESLSDARTTAGGWIYVNTDNLARLTA